MARVDQFEFDTCPELDGEGGEDVGVSATVGLEGAGGDVDEVTPGLEA